MQVCPTGIDIRKGLQYECIGCAACIDACNGVMDKLDYPRGLIRYATQRSLDGRRAAHAEADLPPRCSSTRRCSLIGGAFVASLAFARRCAWTSCATAGLARVVEDGRIENVYRLQVMNTTEAPQQYRISVSGIPGVQASTRGGTTLAPAESRWIPVGVQIGPDEGQALGTGAHPIVFHITGSRRTANPRCRSTKSTFIVPR